MAAPIRSLQETPTWAVATVCFVFIFLGIFIEYLIHLISHWLKKHRKVALLEAVEKLKSVLITLGFMSLILTVTSKLITKICVPQKLSNKMLPCSQSKTTKTSNILQERFLTSDQSNGTQPSDYCGQKGMTSLMSEEGLNQLSVFIFVLAVMQIVYSVLTMALGRAKMRRWKQWETETQTFEYQAANDPNRFRFTRQTTFARRHINSFTTTSLFMWIKCFFRQFFHSVAKVDYLTLRHGFIAAHLSNNNSFNFQKYIQRSLEDDFKVVVGFSPLIWFLVIIFVLVDVHGWNVYLWVSFLPLAIVLVLGTKLEVIVAKMAVRLQDQNVVIKGAPLVEPNDDLFWFSHPKFVLTLLHYTLFMNAFELAFFIWVTLEFGIKSCYHEKVEIIITRVVLAVTVQVMCSYITLPLYALVTQMGSQFKSAVLEEQTAKILKQWHEQIKQKRNKKKDASHSTTTHPAYPTSPLSTRAASNFANSSHQINSPNTSVHQGRTLTFDEITMSSSGQNEIVEIEKETIVEIDRIQKF